MHPPKLKLPPHDGFVAFMSLVRWQKHNISAFCYFVPGGSPTCFGLGRGPITPPGPAMVRMGRRDLNSNKTKQTNKNISLDGKDNTTKATLSSLLPDCSRDRWFRIKMNLDSPISRTGFCRSYANHLLFKDRHIYFSYILHPSDITFSFILPRNWKWVWLH